ncbi:protein serine threonine phosphatase 2C [Desarmillaria tabescens]|uniref:Protein serine threonine phosphatase 2C n=1 Tax=Armillaria tabescens TaxID=1929756 RepID=A0AA39NP55_ARMTA|nr:protein serine threonine phosphatase 2C [Desarmillaria tabescens]KAK0469233.1 protein serine threonine phosphatase 2C [Desarmillaria tabescens]
MSQQVDEQLRTDLARVSNATVKCGAHIVAFQPSTRLQDRIEDRHVVEEWELASGTWKFISVFDGHGAGHETVDFVAETLPGKVKASLQTLPSPSESAIEKILVDCISDIDERIKTDFLDFFPGGLAQISALNDYEIKEIITDPSSETGNSYVQLMRARTGTTALVALISPSKSLFVASLGDCDAILGTLDSIGRQSVKILSAYHNCRNDAEADRVRAEHPGETECIYEYRTLGLITLTRAIGDMPFKLPVIYARRVLALATPPFHPNYKIDALMARNLTPPYLSNQADVVHVSVDQPSVLILSTDGLINLYSRSSQVKNTADAAPLWFAAINRARQDSSNLALDLLWNVLGGDGEANLYSLMMQQQFNSRRVDDTTIIILPL